MNILGLSSFYHDSAAALVRDGVPVRAAQEERFTRKKHDSRFPTHAIKFILESEDLRFEDIDAISFYEKPSLKFDRILKTHIAYAPTGLGSFLQAMPSWVLEKRNQRKLIAKALMDIFPQNLQEIQSKILFAEHHLSHAASSFYPSPFDEAAILTMDGVGEWATTSVGVGSGKDIDIQNEIRFPHSLGLLYSAFTSYTGFKVNAGEYKVMGLAPYGDPKYVSNIYDHLIDVKDDGSFHLNMDYFSFCTQPTMTNEKFHALFGAPPRKSETPLAQREMDLAASVQIVVEETVSKIAKNLAKQSGQKNLCLSGGVALNCVSNGKLLREETFDNIWVQPASGDAGGALGAAMAVYHMHYGMERPSPKGKDAMNGSYLGSSFSDDEIEKHLQAAGAVFARKPPKDFTKEVAAHLSNGKAVGWFQGAMEFGPRALGARSILGDPRSSSMQKTLNLKIKFRESFRPFAPAILAEDVDGWFDHKSASPYMLMVADVHADKQHPMDEDQNRAFGLDKLNFSRSDIPAVTHVDYSARIQTVHADTNPDFYALLKSFKELTGCPILVNTSFNVRGEPIVCTPEDAYRCFMGTHMDVLAIGNFILVKEEQSAKNIEDYKDQFELD